MISCIIIEDEPLALERTKSYASRLPYLQVIATFDNGIEALAFLKINKVDLIFLDIHMDELSGIQLLEAAKLTCEVILTTAYQEYALKGYELNVTDYLLKPFTFERFIAAVEKAGKKLKKTGEQEARYVFVKTEYRLQKVMLSDVLYIEGMRDYRRIHTLSSKIMTLQTFREFEEQIPSGIICRVHKSFMVAFDKIESVERDRIKIRDVFIPISETYKKDFFDRIHYSKK